MCLFIVQNKKEKCYVPKAIYLVSNAGVKPARLFLKLMIQQKYLPAIYTHCYDTSGTRLFAAGGPLQCGLRGNYVALFQ